MQHYKASCCTTWMCVYIEQVCYTPLHWLSHLVCPVPIYETRTMLSDFKISEGWNFYQVILNTQTHTHLPYTSRKLSVCYEVFHRVCRVYNLSRWAQRFFFFFFFDQHHSLLRHLLHLKHRREHVSRVPDYFGTLKSWNPRYFGGTNFVAENI